MRYFRQHKRIIPVSLLVMTLLLSALLSAGTATATQVTIDANNNFRVDGKLFFPLMVWLQDYRDATINRSKAIGINTFAGVFKQDAAKARTYLNQWEKHDVMGIIHWYEIDKKAGSTPNDIRFHSEGGAPIVDDFEEIRNHKALLAWFHSDEPDLALDPAKPNLYPDKTRQAYDYLKQRDTDHPVFMTLTGRFNVDSDTSVKDWCKDSQGNLIEQYYVDYGKSTDVIGFDKYPIYGIGKPARVHWAADAQAELIEKYAQGPTYQWIEAMKCCATWATTPARNNLGPFPQEIRAEAWLAIINGAKALGYFTHEWRTDDCSRRGDHNDFDVTAEQAEVIRTTNARITALTEVLAEPNAGNVIHAVSGDHRVDVMSKVHDGKLYIFAANVLHYDEQPNDKTVTFSVPGLKAGTRVVVYEDGEITAGSGIFTDDFSADEPVHIYVIDDAAAGPSQVQDVTIRKVS